MYFVDKFKQEKVLQDVLKQLIVPVNQKYIKKQKTEKKKISCFKLLHSCMQLKPETCEIKLNFGAGVG